jgi:Reverse transcriptase (RNA-dependent DNA polymerase)
VTSYFNSIYHHDLPSWLHELGTSELEYENFGQYLREINAGRSIDVLPQGLYATKMIGNDFFVDSHHQLKSSQLLRFMDDFYLFSDHPEDIRGDFLLIQQLLGEKSLNLNPHKTSHIEASHTKIDAGIDSIKKRLLDRRREVILTGYDDDNDAIETLKKKPLSKAELDYISDLLAQETLEEDDAELILSVMRDHASKAERKLDYIIQKFPHLMKSISNFCSRISDDPFVADLLLKQLKSEQLQEYQLFWFGHILENQLLHTRKTAELIDLIYSHPRASIISNAKILEIADNRFGLPELRESFLRSGQSDWLSWSAAVGERTLKAASRNHRLN